MTDWQEGRKEEMKEGSVVLVSIARKRFRLGLSKTEIQFFCHIFFSSNVERK